MTVQVEVRDDLVQQPGVGAIRGLLEEELAYQRFRLLDERMQTAMQDRADVNWDTEFEQARQLAFDEYQQHDSGRYESVVSTPTFYSVAY